MNAIKDVARAIWKIRVYDPVEDAIVSRGSGFTYQIAGKTVVITARHVIKPTFDVLHDRPILCNAHGNRKGTSIKALSLAVSNHLDVAVLWLGSLDEDFILDDSTRDYEQTGARLYAVGWGNHTKNPVQYAGTLGITNPDYHKRFGEKSFIADIPLMQGDSGCPVLNKFNQLYGMFCAINTKTFKRVCIHHRELVQEAHAIIDGLDTSTLNKKRMAVGE